MDNQPDDTYEEQLLAEATALGLAVPELDDAPPGAIRTQIELQAALATEDEES